jgi:hypothetical protein
MDEVDGGGELFPDAGGIVIGERYRVDTDDAAQSFRADRPEHLGCWGQVATALLRRLVRFVSWNRVRRFGRFQDDVGDDSNGAQMG